MNEGRPYPVIESFQSSLGIEGEATRKAYKKASFLTDVFFHQIDNPPGPGSSESDDREEQIKNHERLTDEQLEYVKAYLRTCYLIGQAQDRFLAKYPNDKDQETTFLKSSSRRDLQLALAEKEDLESAKEEDEEAGEYGRGFSDKDAESLEVLGTSTTSDLSEEEQEIVGRILASFEDKGIGKERKVRFMEIETDGPPFIYGDLLRDKMLVDAGLNPFLEREVYSDLGMDLSEEPALTLSELGFVGRSLRGKVLRQRAIEALLENPVEESINRIKTQLGEENFEGDIGLTRALGNTEKLREQLEEIQKLIEHCKKELKAYHDQGNSQKEVADALGAVVEGPEEVSIAKEMLDIARIHSPYFLS